VNGGQSAAITTNDSRRDELRELRRDLSQRRGDTFAAIFPGVFTANSHVCGSTTQAEDVREASQPPGELHHQPVLCSKLLQTEPEYLRGVIDQVVTSTKDNDERRARLPPGLGPCHGPFRPLHARAGAMGLYHTGRPRADDDAEHIVEVTCAALHLARIHDQDPVIASGMEPSRSVARNIPICATEIFAVAQATHICEAYIGRHEERKATPFYVTHITGIFDQYLAEVSRARDAIARDPGTGRLPDRPQAVSSPERAVTWNPARRRCSWQQHFTSSWRRLHITINWARG